MSHSENHSRMSRVDLIALTEQLGSWRAVEQYLGLSHHQLHVLKCELGVPLRPTQSRPSQLALFHDEISLLAAEGYTCLEIVRELDLPVKAEQVRRYMHKHGIPLLAKRGAQPGEKNPSWNGGMTVDKAGYILVRCPDHPYANRAGYVREHRLVMEQVLGRYLEPGEVVHHINGDPSDNRPENLEVFSSNGEHLAKTLQGKVPNWTEDGKERISQALKVRWAQGEAT